MGCLDCLVPYFKGYTILGFFNNNSYYLYDLISYFNAGMKDVIANVKSTYGRDFNNLKYRNLL